MVVQAEIALAWGVVRSDEMPNKCRASRRIKDLSSDHEAKQSQARRRNTVEIVELFPWWVLRVIDVDGGIS